VNGHVLVSFLEAIVFLDVVKIIASDDAGPLHLHLRYHSRQNSSSDAHVPRERTLLVDVRARRRLFRGLEDRTSLSKAADHLFK